MNDKKVLLVDDSLTVRMDLKEILEEIKVECLLANSLTEASQILSDEKVSLIILDVNLPDGSGLDFLQDLRADPKFSDIPVIMLSSKKDVEARVQGLRRGADFYLGKPYVKHQVTNAVCELIGKVEELAPVYKLLLIDDSLTFCEEMKEALINKNYEVLIAVNGEDAFRKLEKEQVDLIIVDGMLPDCNGIDIVRKLRLSPVFHLTLCLFLTGGEKITSEVSALDAGADAYVHKEEGIEFIVERIASLFRLKFSSFFSKAQKIGKNPIVLLSDQSVVKEWFSSTLQLGGFDVVNAKSVEKALELLEYQDIDCLLIDEALCGNEARNICQRFRMTDKLKRIPVIFFEKGEATDKHHKFLEWDVDDWIVLDQITPSLALAKVKSLVRRKTLLDHEKKVGQALFQHSVEINQSAHALSIHKKIFECMPIGLLILKLEDENDLGSFRYIYKNEAAIKAFGVDRRDIGKTIAEFYPEFLDTEIPALYLEALRSNEVKALPRIIYGDKNVPESVFDLFAAPLMENYIGIFIENITERVKTEKRLQSAERQEAIGKLAGGIAHDFNNILGIINISAYLLEKRLSEEKQIKDVVAIKTAVQRASGLTNQLLAFGKKQVQRVENISVNEHIKSIESLLTKTIGQHIQIKTDLAEDISPILMDPTQLEQIILNLGVNARDALSMGGKIKIETRERIVEKPFLKDEDVIIKTGEYVQISFSDNGEGMDSEVVSKIFDPYFTTKPQGKGTGLGLSTVWGIVKQNNGHIFVYSEKGKGTTFKIFFPKTIGQLSISAKKVNVEKSFDLEPCAILLVDDEDYIREGAARLLEENGHKVFRAENGKVALEFLKDTNEKIDILITDVLMPEVGGIELVKEALKTHGNLKIIFMSGHLEDIAGIESLSEKCHYSFISKPFSLTELLSKITKNNQVVA